MQDKQEKYKKADKVKCLGCSGNWDGICCVPHECVRKLEPPEPIAVTA